MPTTFHLRVLIQVRKLGRRTESRECRPPKKSAQADAPDADPDRKPDRETTLDITAESSPAEGTAIADETANDSDVSVQPEPRVRRNSHSPGLTIASVKPVKPISADPSATRTAPIERQPTQPT